MKKIVRNGTLALIACVIGAPAFAADDEELAAARDFLTLSADVGGYEGLKGRDLEQAARGVVRSCTWTPAAQLPRGILKACEEFDGYKRIRARERRRKALEDR